MLLTFTSIGKICSESELPISNKLLIILHFNFFRIIQCSEFYVVNFKIFLAFIYIVHSNVYNNQIELQSIVEQDSDDAVDAVYTWVNGSDIDFQKLLAQTDVGTKTNALDMAPRRFTGEKNFHVEILIIYVTEI